MSKSVDERVVSMKFDNKQFEQNVKTSMSTLEKLKQSLNFKDSAKGLENVSNAAKKFDISPMSNGVETVKAKFSALQIIGVTALANIANSAVNSAKRIISAFTIDPIRTGLNEYELKMNSVQTIMMSTGEKVETVNKYLEELNAYSDRTIYSFQDMTSNIGKFTNAGVKLEDAVAAIKGISNEAAISGANANEASRAMYNFSQALSSGYVKLIDWKSIENANMATMEFKQQLIDTAVACGTLTKTADGMYSTGKRNITATKDFNDSLQDQWMTSEVLIETLKKYTDESTDIGKKAYEAAEKVKTFSQMMDVLKETAQSGWAKTWEIIFGDLEQAKSLFTPLTKFFGGIIESIDDFRNTILETALSSPLGQLAKKVSSFSEATETASETMQDYGDIVKRVINGELGEGQARFNKLTEMGYDYAHVQNLVNEQLGNGFRRAVELSDAQKGQTKSTEKLTDAKLKELGLTEKEISLYRDLEKQSAETGKSISELITEMDGMTGRELLIESFKNIGSGLVTVFKSIGAAWKEVFPSTAEDKAAKLYHGLQGLYDITSKFANIMKENGEEANKIKRTFAGLFAILDLLKTVVGGGLGIAFKVFKAVLGALHIDILDVTAAVGDAIVKFRNWLKEHDLITKAVEFLIPLMKDAALVIRDWAEETKVFEKASKEINKFFTNTIDPIKKWVKGIKEAENIPQYIISGLVNGLKSGVSKIWNTAIELGSKILDAVKNVLGIHSPSIKFMEVGQYAMEGLGLGIQNGASGVISLISAIGSKLIETIQGLDFSKVLTGVFVGSFALSAKGLFDVMRSVSGVIKSFGGLLDGLHSLVSRVGKGIFSVLDGLGKSLKANAWVKYGEAIKSFAIAIAILAGSVFILSKIPVATLWIVVGAIVTLATIMAGLVLAIQKITASQGVLNTAKLSGVILAVGTAMILMAGVMKIVSKISDTDALKGLASIGVFALIISKLIESTSKAGDPERLKNIGKVIRSVGTAMLLMSVTMKIIGGMSNTDAAKGLASITVFALIISKLIESTNKAGTPEKLENIRKVISSVGKTMLLMGVTMRLIGGMDTGSYFKGLAAVSAFGLIIGLLIRTTDKAGTPEKLESMSEIIKSVGKAIVLMAVAMRLVGGMETGSYIKGIVVVGLFGVLTIELMKYSKLATANDISKLGGVILAISGAMILMGITMRLASGMSVGEIAKGVAVVVAFGGIITGLIAATKLASKDENINKIGTTLLMLSGSLMIMAICLQTVCRLDPSSIAKGLSVMVGFGGIITGLIAATKLAGKNMKQIGPTLLMVSGSMLLLAGVLWALSELDPTKMAKGLAAITIMTGLFAGLLAVTKFAHVTKTVRTTLMLMVGIIVILAGVVTGLSFLPNPDAAIKNSIAVGILLEAIAGALVIIDKVGRISKSAKQTAAILVGVIAGLAAILGIMAGLKAEASIQNSIAIGILLEALAGALIILDHVGTISNSTLGSIAILSLVVLELGAVLAILSGFEISVSIDTAAALSVLLIGLSAACVVASKIPLAGAVEGAAGLAAFIGIMAAVLVAAGGIKQIPGVEWLVEEGGEFLAKIGYALGDFVGSIIGGIGDGLTSGLPNIATHLSEFMENLRPFLGGAKSVDSETVSSVLSIAEMILVLTAADILDGIASFFGCGSSLSDFAEELVAFTPALNKFASKTANIDGAKLKKVADATLTLVQMASEVPNEGGLVAKITGENSLKDFGKELEPFADSLVAFANKTAGIDATQVKKAAKASAELVKVAKAVPNSGGLVAKITGDNSLKEFGKELVSFGPSLRKFANHTAGIDASQVKKAAKASAEMVKVAKAVPNSGGLVAKITGDNSLKEFGKELAAFGPSLKTFANHTAGIDTDAIKKAAKACKSLIKVAEAVPNSGGLVSKITGDNSLKEFGEEIAPFGKSLRAFEMHISGIKSESIKEAVKAAKSLVKMADWMDDYDYSSIEDFPENLPDFGKNLKSYYDATSGISDATSVQQASKCAKSIAKMAVALSDYDYSDIKTFPSSLTTLGSQMKVYYNVISDIDFGAIQNSVSGISGIALALKMTKGVSADDAKGLVSAINEAAKANVKGLIDAFKNTSGKTKNIGTSVMKNLASGIKRSSNTPISAARNVVSKVVSSLQKTASKFTPIGKKFMTNLANGIKTASSSVKSSVTKATDGASSGAKKNYNAFKEAGKYLGDGLINGIKAKETDVYNAAYKLGQKAVQGEKDGQKSKSPSRATIQAGKWLGEGLVIGINNMSDTVYKAGHSMGSSAVNSIGKSLTKVKDAINNGLDVQPKITPVFEAGSFQASSFELGATINTSITGQFTSLNQMFSGIQKGIETSNNNVVSAIKDLKEDITGLQTAVENIKTDVYMDSRKVASSLAKPMNRELSNLAKRGGV